MADTCPHCPDGDHDDPRRKPWSVWVGPGETPFALHVAPSAGGHVAESDAEWLRELIRTHRGGSGVTPVDDEVRDRVAEALTREHYRRARERIAASPEEHSAAMADAALAVRDEELERLRGELEKTRADCEEEARAARSLRRELDRLRAALDQARDERDDVLAELERLRGELAEASDALRAVAKAALTVEPTLREPYRDAPDTLPWQRFMEEPARRAYNLGVRLRRHMKETPDA